MVARVRRTRTAATPSRSRRTASKLWVGSARDSDLIRLVELDPADGSEREIDRDDEVDLSGPMISDVTGELLGAVYLRDRVVTHICDERLARDWEAAARAPPRATRASPARTPTRRRSSSAFDDDRDPGATFHYDRDDGRVAAAVPLAAVARPGDAGADAAGHDHLARRPGAAQLPDAAARRRAAGTCRRCCWCTAGRGRATRGATTRRPSSSPTAATRCCRSTTGARPASARRSPTPASTSSPGKMHDDLIDAVEWAGGRGHRRPRTGSRSTAARTAATRRSSGATFTPDVFAAAISLVGPSSLVTLVALVPAVLAAAAGEHVVPLRRRPGRPGAGRRPRGALAAQPRGRASRRRCW